MLIRNPAFLGRVRLAGGCNLGQARECSDDEYKRAQDNWFKAAKAFQDAYQAESEAWANFKSASAALKQNETAENFQKQGEAESQWRKAEKDLKDAEHEYRLAQDALRDCNPPRQATSMMPSSVQPSSAYIPQGPINQPQQSYANVHMTPTTPATPSIPAFSDQHGFTMEDFKLPPTEPPPYINPHAFDVERSGPIEGVMPTEGETQLPGAEQAAGLPCPPGQERPPGGGWCSPKQPVATGYGGGRPGGFGGFGGYGGAINMAPSGTSFTMAGRAMLGRVRLARRPY